MPPVAPGDTYVFGCWALTLGSILAIIRPVERTVPPAVDLWRKLSAAWWLLPTPAFEDMTAAAAATAGRRTGAFGRHGAAAWSEPGDATVPSASRHLRLVSWRGLLYPTSGEGTSRPPRADAPEDEGEKVASKLVMDAAEAASTPISR